MMVGGLSKEQCMNHVVEIMKKEDRPLSSRQLISLLIDKVGSPATIPLTQTLSMWCYAHPHIYGRNGLWRLKSSMFVGDDS